MHVTNELVPSAPEQRAGFARPGLDGPIPIVDLLAFGGRRPRNGEHVMWPHLGCSAGRALIGPTDPDPARTEETT